MRRIVAISIGTACLLAIGWPLLKPRHDAQSTGPSYDAGDSVGIGRVQPQLTFGYDVGVLLAPDGSLWTWGGTYRLMPGRVPSETPVLLTTNRTWAAVAATYDSIAAIREDGSLWLWGNLTPRTTPSAPPTPCFQERRFAEDARWQAVAGGSGHFIVLKSDGTVWTWGENQFGQLGDGTRNSSAQPIQIGTRDGWVAVAAGAFNSFALRKDGTIWGWGRDFTSTLGGGGDLLSPNQLDEGGHWVAISAGGFNCAALKSDGSIWLLGPGAAAMLSKPSSGQAGTFIQIEDDGGWQSVRVSAVNVYAVKSDGSVWGFGANAHGQLGEAAQRWAQEWVPLPSVWSFGAGQQTFLLLARDGVLWTQGARLGAPMKSPPIHTRATIWFLNTILRKRVAMPPSTFETDIRPRKIWEMPEKMRQDLVSTNSIRAR